MKTVKRDEIGTDHIFGDTDDVVRAYKHQILRGPFQATDEGTPRG